MGRWGFLSLLLLVFLFQNCSESFKIGEISADNPMGQEVIEFLNEEVRVGDKNPTDDDEESQLPSVKETENDQPEHTLDPFVEESLFFLQKSLDKYLDSLKKGTSTPYWSIAKNLRTAYQLYWLNKDVEVLEYLLKSGEELVKYLSINQKTKDFLHKKPVYAWMTGSYSCGKSYSIMVLNMILIDNTAFAMTELLKSKKRDQYDKRIKRLATIYEKIFVHFRGEFVKNKRGYVFSTKEKLLSKVCNNKDYLSRSKTLVPLNMNTAAGMAHFRMYGLNSVLKQTALKNWHKTRFSLISSLVKKSLLLWKINNQEGLKWLYKENGRSEDTSHAFMTIRYITSLKENGWAFSNTHLKRLATTFHHLYGDGKKVHSHLSDNYGRIDNSRKSLDSLSRMSLLCQDVKVLEKVKNLINRGYGGLYSKVALARYSRFCPYE